MLFLGLLVIVENSRALPSKTNPAVLLVGRSGFFGDCLPVQPSQLRKLEREDSSRETAEVSHFPLIFHKNQKSKIQVKNLVGLFVFQLVRFQDHILICLSLDYFVWHILQLHSARRSSCSADLSKRNFSLSSVLLHRRRSQKTARCG